MSSGNILSSWIAYIPNSLSLMRIPLSLCFLSDDMTVRLVALFLAGCSDIIDGWLSRKLGVSSSLGAVLDPVGDKCFTGVMFFILWNEGALNLMQLSALFTREFSLCCFAGVLLMRGEWKSYCVRAIWSGKLITLLQMVIAFLLIVQQPVPFFAYLASFLLGVVAFGELLLRLTHVRYPSQLSPTEGR